MILVYGNDYIENREYTRQTTINDSKEMFNKVVAYLSKMEENMNKKNLKVPNDWYKNIKWKIISK